MTPTPPPAVLIASRWVNGTLLTTWRLPTGERVELAGGPQDAKDQVMKAARGDGREEAPATALQDG